MTLLRLMLLSPLMFPVAACSEFTNRSTPCGGTLQVDATVALPDTGLGAGGSGNVSFFESEADRTPDDTALGVWTFPPANTTFADGPPRVRVLTDDGRVFLDLQSTSAFLGSWYVLQPIRDHALREEIVAAFHAKRVVVEFVRTQPEQKTTRVRPDVRFAGRTPVLRCV